MRRQRTIGLFVLGGAALLALTLTLFSSGKWFRDTDIVMMTFEGDVKGLSIGSRITFRGVQIGSISSIALHLNPDGGVTVPVLAEIDTSNKTFEMVRKDRRELLQNWINRGLKARLASESFVTGRLQIQLEFFPEQDGYLMLEGNTRKYQQIPTVPTALEEATNRLERFARSFENMPLEDIAQSMAGTLSTLDRHLNSAEFSTMLVQLSEASTHLNSLLAHLDQQKTGLTGGLTTSFSKFQHMTERATLAADSARELTTHANHSVAGLDQTLTTLNRTLEQTTRTLQAFEGLTKPEAPVQQSLLQALRTLDAAGQQLRQLAETLQRNPESILTGKPKR